MIYYPIIAYPKYFSPFPHTHTHTLVIPKVAETPKGQHNPLERIERKNPKRIPIKRAFFARNRCSVLTRTHREYYPYTYIYIFDRSYPVTMQVKSQNLFLFLPGSAVVAAFAPSLENEAQSSFLLLFFCYAAQLPADLKLISFWLLVPGVFSEFRAVPFVFLFFLHTFEKAAKLKFQR